MTDRRWSTSSARGRNWSCRPRPPLGEAGNFGVFMMKAVIDGRFGELIDLAKVNLTR